MHAETFFPAAPAPSPPGRGSLRLWRRVLVPAGSWLALAALAAAQADLSSGAEIRFLGLMAAGCLAAIAALTPERPHVEWTAAAVVAACWCVAESTLRGGLVCAVLLAATAIAVRASRGGAILTFTASALVWQLLTRPDLLLAPWLEARTLVSIAVLPILCGVALARLSAVHGAPAAWAAGLAAAVVAPGFNVTVTVTLIAAAAGRDLDHPSGRRRLVAAGLIAGAAVVAWPLGLAVAAASAAGLLTTWRRWWIAAAALGGTTSAVAMMTTPGYPVSLLVFAALILPTGLFAGIPADGDARRRVGMALLALAAGAGVVDDPEALAPGLVLLATLLPGRWVHIQRRFGTWLAAAVGLTAAYPWLHRDPLLLLDQPAIFAAAVVACVGAVFLVDRALESRGLRPLPLWLPVAAAAFALAPGPALVQLEVPRVLDTANDAAVWPLAAEGARVVQVDSNLVHGAHLEPGTPVADVELLDAYGQVVASKPLRAGLETADWASGRPDISAQLGDAGPEPWSSRPAPDGTFFERRYRATLSLEAPVTVVDLRVRRRADL
ncbi:MAG: hypothetical protein AAFY88_04900, partial [Acidobacteriota bacterium]